MTGLTYALTMSGELDDIQNQTLTVLAKILVPGQRVAILDFPNHENSGDSLIYLGELEYLRRLNVEIAYVADQSRYSVTDLQRLHPHGPILIHGGGNFGDRWESFQAMRERIIKDFPDRDIIQLPQSIEFTPGPRLRQAQSVMNAHPSLTLLMRDHIGVRKAAELFPAATVIFCPDAAFGVGTITSNQQASVDLVLVRRQDSEAVENVKRFDTSGPATTFERDWGLNGFLKLRSLLLHIPGAIVKRLPSLGVKMQPLLQRCYIAQARLNVASAVKILGRARHCILTDRLHCVVLAALMGKCVVAVDNANGKISAICADYLGSFPGVYFAAELSSAEELVEEMISAS